MTLTNEKENVLKSSIVMTPGYTSGVRIIGVASATVIPTATQEAPLSKTSAFSLPQTVMQTAEKVLGTEAPVQAPAQQAIPQNNPDIFPKMPETTVVQPTMQVPVEPAPIVESTPVEVSSPQELNNLVSGTITQNIQTEPLSQQENINSYTMPQELNNNQETNVTYDTMPQNQFEPSNEIVTPVTENIKNETPEVAEMTPINEPPVLPNFDNINDNLNAKNVIDVEVINIIKDYIQKNIETSNELLKKLEEYEKKVNSQKSEQKSEELQPNNTTMNFATGPEYSPNYNNVYPETMNYSETSMHM